MQRAARRLSARARIALVTTTVSRLDRPALRRHVQLSERARETRRCVGRLNTRRLVSGSAASSAARGPLCAGGPARRAPRWSAGPALPAVGAGPLPRCRSADSVRPDHERPARRFSLVEHPSDCSSLEVVGEAPPAPPLLLPLVHGRHRICLTIGVYQSGSTPGSSVHTYGGLDCGPQVCHRFSRGAMQSTQRDDASLQVCHSRGMRAFEADAPMVIATDGLEAAMGALCQLEHQDPLVALCASTVGSSCSTCRTREHTRPIASVYRGVVNRSVRVLCGGRTYWQSPDRARNTPDAERVRDTTTWFSVEDISTGPWRHNDPGSHMRNYNSLYHLYGDACRRAATTGLHSGARRSL